MVKKTQWILLFTTFVVSICSLIFIIVAFSVDNWIKAEAESSQSFIDNSQIHYGLFSGYLTRFVLSQSYHQLTMTCLYEENACFYSCQATPALREDELRRILAGASLLSCPIASRSGEIKISSNFTQTNYSVPTFLRQYSGNVYDDVIDPGLWLTTIIFLSVTAAFSIFSALMALLNIVYNPIQPIFSVFGLYIWNGIASGTTLITLILWGVLYGTSLSRNIAITDTLNSEFAYTSSGLASLGFCYWLLLVPMVFHAGNMGLLYWRKIIIEAEPPPPTINVDKNDFTIMLY